MILQMAVGYVLCKMVFVLFHVCRHTAAVCHIAVWMVFTLQVVACHRHSGRTLVFDQRAFPVCTRPTADG